MYDYLIQNARLIDGSGNPSYLGGVAVKGGKIAAVGNVSGFMGEPIDASGLAVCPGFIDIHRHADLMPLHSPNSEMELRQGITTVLSGNCGFSPFPWREEHARELREFLEPLLGPLPTPVPWRDFSSYAAQLGQCDLPVNLGTLVGNGAVRVAVRGMRSGALTAGELEQARLLIGQALDNGAFGLSLGLMYLPENCYSTEELRVLCAEAGKRCVPIAVHLRGEGALLVSSVREMLEVTLEVGAHLHISHFKSAGRKNWEIGWKEGIRLIREAQKQGVNVTWDAYPYEAGSTSLQTLMPPWVQEGGMDAMLERLKNPAQRKKIALELRTEHRGWDNLVCSTGWDRVMISSSAVPGCIGKTVAQLAQDRGVLPEELAFDLILEERGKTGMVFFHMCEEDVREILQLPETALISDTLYLPGAATHPRAWGAQARLIGRCARDEGWMSLEQAVEKCTGLPARYFAIEGRGLLRPGYAADLVVFDPASILDRADYLNPVQPPHGIEWVFVNGRPALHGGKLLDTKAGEILLRGV